MAKKGKRDNRPGQRKGDQHKAPTKQALPVPKAPIASPNINQQPQPVAANNGPQNDAQSDTEELAEAVDRHTRLNTWFTFAIMAATVAQVIVGWVQWRAMREQNADTRRQADLAMTATQQTEKTLDLMRQEQRPWLAATAERIEPLDVIADPELTIGQFNAWFSKWAIKVRNAGQTPAVNVRWAVDWVPHARKGQLYAYDTRYERQELTQHALNEYFEEPYGPIDITIAPAESMTFRMNYRKRNAYTGHLPSPSEDERVMNFSESRIIGAFIYNDLRGKEYTLFCCFRHDPETGQLEMEDCSVDYPTKNERLLEPPSDEPVASVYGTAESFLNPPPDRPLKDGVPPAPQVFD